MGTARNFTVKTGLDIDDGDLTLTDGDILLTAGFLQSTPASGNPLKIDGSTISTLSGDHNINITPNGTGSVVISKSELTTTDINGGTIDAVTIATSDITVGTGKTLDVSGGTLTLAADQISGDAINGGTIGSITITALAGALSLGDNNITNVGDLNVDSISVDDAEVGLDIVFGGNTTLNKITLTDSLADALNITEGSNSYMKFNTSDEQIEIGEDLQFEGSANHKISIAPTSGNNQTGRDLIFEAGTSTGNVLGGEMVFKVGGGGGSTGSTPTSLTTALTLTGAGVATIPTADINGGNIDGTNIGVSAQGTAKVSTLETTGHARINGSAKEANSHVQINGDSRAGTANSDTGNMYSELRLYSDIANDDLAGSWNGYYGMSNAVILENAEDVKTSGQGIVHTVGTGANTGSTWAIGRMSGTSDIFTLGYFADNWDEIGYVNASSNGQDTENPFLSANSKLSLNASGDMFLNANGASFNFTGATSGGAARKIGFKASSNGVTASGDEMYVLPVGFPTGNKILQSSSSGALTWVAAGSGESNQTLTTGNGISGANGGSTGDFTIAVEGAQTTITSVKNANLVIGRDADNDIDFSTDNIITFRAAAVDQVKLIDNVFGPVADSDVDLGTNLLRWKDLYVDSITVTNDAVISADVRMNTDGASIGFGGDGEVSLTHIHNKGLRLGAGNTLEFRGAGEKINSTGTGNLTIAADSEIVVSSPDVTVTSTTTSKPLFTIKNTHNGTTAGELRFVSDDGAAGADGDDIGTISFYADDSGQNQTAFASIVAEVSESADTDEAGKLTFFIAESDGTNTAQTAALILEGEHATDGQVDVTIGAGAASTTTIVGDLVVNGSTTTISTAQLTVEDSLITVAKGNDSLANADGAGIEIECTGATNPVLIYNNASTAWRSNVDIDTSGTGNTYKINGTEVLNATTLGGAVVTSSLTTVGALNSGSITSGFGTIDTGSSTITTTGLISGGSLDIDDVLINGATIGHTNDTDLITLANGLVTVAGEISVTTLDIGGTNVTSTAAELNLVDGITAGTVSASKAVIVDSDKDVTGFRNVTGTGALQGATLSVDAVAILDTASGDSATISGETNLFSIPKATYKAAKILYHIKKDDNNRTDAGEILVTHDGTNAFLTHYGQVNTDTSAVVGTWDCTVNSANIEVRFTPTANGAHSYCLVATQLIVEP